MREQTALIKEFNQEEQLVSEPKPRRKLENERLPVVLESFRVPSRPWERLIDDYNIANKQKFNFTPLECKVIIEFVKKDIPPEEIFQTLGYSKARYNNFVNKSLELDGKLEELATKGTLNDDDYDLFQTLIRHPLRILISDIQRAQGLANLVDWENFNAMAATNPDLLVIKMKSKFRDKFTDRSDNTGNVNVQINVGGNWLEDL